MEDYSDWAQYDAWRAENVEAAYPESEGRAMMRGSNETPRVQTEARMEQSMHRLLAVLLLTLLYAPLASAQNLPVKWGELTAPDFVQALEQADGVCLLPFGVIEKHGPAGPLGTDLLSVRHASLSAAQQEYAIVFPEYYFGHRL